MGATQPNSNTIAVDDGIAMGHDGMLYSLPSRDINIDSGNTWSNAHKADADLHLKLRQGNPGYAHGIYK